jgi:hypothetical protein
MKSAVVKFRSDNTLVEKSFSSRSSSRLTDNAVWLGKKSRLSGPILRVAKVAQADANQAKPLVRSEDDTL